MPTAATFAEHSQEQAVKTFEDSGWSEEISGRSDPVGVVRVEIPVEPNRGRSGSGAFLAIASDKQEYFIKPHNSPQGGRVLVNELVISSLGRLIGAPVCKVSVVEIPKEIEGWEFTIGYKLEAGLASASLRVPDVHEMRATPQHRERDENAVRHAGVLALYDLCWGGDGQWLYSTSEDERLWSHDHGHYFPDGPNWTEASLASKVDEPRILVMPTDGLDSAELDRLASTLDRLTRAALVGILSEVPSSWSVSDTQLARLGFFLESRAPAVAERLRAAKRSAP